MAKAALKERIKAKQNGVGALSGVVLPEDVSLYDTDRKQAKAEGGIYTDENTRVVDPVEHLKRHGNYRVRPDHLDELKAILSDREQTRKLYQKINNQLLAGKRGDKLLPKTIETLEEAVGHWRKELAARDKALIKQLEANKTDLIDAALGVESVGPITVAYMTVYIDLEKARYASSMWSYVGLDKAAKDRYTKGVKGGGCKPLRTVLYTLADSQVKGRGAYRKVYDDTKTRLENSSKIVWSRNTEGEWIECAWKDTKPCHRHGAALRQIMKHFLADYWYVGRDLAGLDTSPLYAEAVLGGHRTVMPEERGWKYKQYYQG